MTFSTTPTLFLPLAESGMGTVIARSLVMIAFIIVAFLAVVRLRKWLTSDDDDAGGPSAVGFSLSDLKQLHRDGKISAEEFERARAKMVGAAKEMAAKLPDPLERSRRRQQPPPGGGPEGGGLGSGGLGRGPGGADGGGGGGGATA